MYRSQAIQSPYIDILPFEFIQTSDSLFESFSIWYKPIIQYYNYNNWYIFEIRFIIILILLYKSISILNLYIYLIYLSYILYLFMIWYRYIFWYIYIGIAPEFVMTDENNLKRFMKLLTSKGISVTARRSFGVEIGI